MWCTRTVCTIMHSGKISGYYLDAIVSDSGVHHMHKVAECPTIIDCLLINDNNMYNNELLYLSTNIEFLFRCTFNGIVGKY